MCDIITVNHINSRLQTLPKGPAGDKFALPIVNCQKTNVKPFFWFCICGIFKLRTATTTNTANLANTANTVKINNIADSAYEEKHSK